MALRHGAARANAVQGAETGARIKGNLLAGSSSADFGSEASVPLGPYAALPDSFSAHDWYYSRSTSFTSVFTTCCTCRRTCSWKRHWRNKCLTIRRGHRISFQSHLSMHHRLFQDNLSLLHQRRQWKSLRAEPMNQVDGIQHRRQRSETFHVSFRKMPNVHINLADPWESEAHVLGCKVDLIRNMEAPNGLLTYPKWLGKLELVTVRLSIQSWL